MNGTEELIDIRRRFDYAVERGRVLSHSLAAVVEHDPPQIQHSFNEATKHFEWSLLHLPKCAPDTSFVLGDVVHNLRSCLDNMVWTLARKNGTRGDALREAAFPICSSRAEYDNQGSKKVSGLPTSLQDVVAAWQPYNSAEEDLQPLRWLQHLSNVDKHRMFHVAANATVGQGLNLLTEEGLIAVSESPLERTGGLLAEGETFARLHWPHDFPLHAEVAFAVDWVFTTKGPVENKPVAVALAFTTDVVDRILQAFEDSVE